MFNFFKKKKKTNYENINLEQAKLLENRDLLYVALSDAYIRGKKDVDKIYDLNVFNMLLDKFKNKPKDVVFDSAKLKEYPLLDLFVVYSKSILENKWWIQDAVQDEIASRVPAHLVDRNIIEENK